MGRTICLLTLQLLLAGSIVHRQTARETGSSNYILVKTGRMLDVKTGHDLIAFN